MALTPTIDLRHSDTGSTTSPEQVRSLIARGWRDPARFRAALTAVPPAERDGWVNRVLALGAPPDDGPELPRGGVPYLPCGVDALLRLTEHTSVRATDVFVDVGSGVGRAAVLVHLLTGAPAIGLEIQPALVCAARALVSDLGLTGVSFVQGDAPELTATLALGSVFLLYCPFSGDRLQKFLAGIQPVARAREVRIACVDLPLPSCAWLEPASVSAPWSDLEIYKSAPPQLPHAAEHSIVP